MNNLLTLVICLVALMVFERTQAKISTEREKFAAQLEELKVKKESLLAMQVHLEEMINSESDPAYVELVLKEKLGVVPEGQKKVILR